MRRVRLAQRRFPACFEELQNVGEFVSAFLHAAPGVPDEETFRYNMMLAVHEVATNIIDHAYKGLNPGFIDLLLKVRNGVFSAELRDTGHAFNRDAILLPDLENGQVRGYGIYILEQLMDDVRYTSKSDHNVWQLIKRC